jgi:hypothetical protein
MLQHADCLLTPAVVQEPAAATVFLPAGGELRRRLGRDDEAELLEAASASHGRGAGEVGGMERDALGRGHAPHHAGLARHVHAALAQCRLRGVREREVCGGGVAPAGT